MNRVNQARTGGSRATRRRSRRMTTPYRAQVPTTEKNVSVESKTLASPKQPRNTATEPAAKILSRKREDATESAPSKTAKKCRHHHLRGTTLPKEISTSHPTDGADRGRRNAPGERKGRKHPRALTAEAGNALNTSRQARGIAPAGTLSKSRK